MSVNNDLKHHLIQALDLFFGLGFTIQTLLGNIAPYGENWQSLKGKNLLFKQQEVLTRIEAKLGVNI